MPLPSVVAEGRYCWRASPALPAEVLDRFEELANGWVGLLRWLRAEHKVTSVDAATLVAGELYALFIARSIRRSLQISSLA